MIYLQEGPFNSCLWHSINKVFFVKLEAVKSREIALELIFWGSAWIFKKILDWIRKENAVVDFVYLLQNILDFFAGRNCDYVEIGLFLEKVTFFSCNGQ